MTNFKVGDLVCCIDPTSANGQYCVTHYKRICRVVCIDNDEMRVACVAKECGDNNNWDFQFLVEKKYFAKIKAEVL